MKRKFLAVALAAAMTVTSVGVVSAAEAGTAPEPSIKLTFDGEMGEGTYSEAGIDFTVKGGAEIVAPPDDLENNILALDADNDGTATGTDCLYSDTGVLSDLDFTEGFSVSMKIKPTVQFTDWNYLFGIGYVNTPAVDEYFVDVSMGFSARYALVYKAQTPGDFWQEGNPANSEWDFFKKEDNAWNWYDYTVVYEKNAISIYLDGILTVKYETVEADFETVLEKLTSGSLNIGCGIDPALDRYSGYIDDVAIYEKALTAEEVAAVVAGVEEEPEEPNEETITGTDWWVANEAGQDYLLENDKPITLEVTFSDTTGENGYGAFCVEAYNIDDYENGWYFTTGSDQNAWFAKDAEVDGTNITGVAETFASTIELGKTYLVEIGHDKDTITITYIDKETEETYAEFVGTSKGNIPDTLRVHVIAQVGTYDISTYADLYPVDDPTTDDPTTDDPTTDDPANPDDNKGDDGKTDTDDGKTDTDDGKTDTDNGNNNTGNNGAANDNGNAGNGGSASVDQPAQTGDVAPYMILVLGAAAVAVVVFARKREEA